MTFEDRIYIMGILNVTPDSFSDGGMYFAHTKAIERGIEMEREGADIIDIGGESTRPGATPVPVEEELKRVIPVIKELAGAVNIPISIDTYKSEVAKRAIEAGASIVNDVSALRFDPSMVRVLKEYNVKIVLMHMLGTPATMQTNIGYKDVIEDVYEFLKERIEFAEAMGIKKDRIIIDPGIGFGKKLIHNLLLIKHIDKFKELGCPVLIGPSRKSFIGEILHLPVPERLEGTAGAVAFAIMKGVNIVRVHDVRPIKHMIQVMEAIKKAGNKP